MKKKYIFSLVILMISLYWFCDSRGGFGINGIYLDMGYRNAKNALLGMYKSSDLKYEIYDKDGRWTIREKVRGLDYAEIEIYGSYNNSGQRVVCYVSYNAGAVEKFINADNITAEDFISDYIGLPLKKISFYSWRYKSEEENNKSIIYLYQEERGLSLTYRND